VGAGAQDETQLLVLQCLFSAGGGAAFSGKIEKVKVASLDFESSKRFAAKMSAATKLPVEAVATIKEAVDADIVCTATPSRNPIVAKEWIKPGTHINAIGADAAGKEELDPEILKNAKIVIDNWAQASHSGEINVPLSKRIICRENVYAELGEIVAGVSRAPSLTLSRFLRGFPPLTLRQAGAYPPEEKLPFFFPPISSGPPIFSRSSPAGQQYPIANAKKILEVAGARQTFQLNIPNTIHGSKCRL
jgi:hypothetical protein